MHNILIVEDEKLIRQGIKAIVERSGVPIQTILECNNGLTALDILRTDKIDIMFTDIRMPKMDGIELVRAINQLEHKPLIVAISGYDDFNYAVELLREGVREYILKPVERGQIKSILEKLTKELEAQKQQEEDRRRIGWQQLKYFILDHYSTAEEKELIIKEYGKKYLNKPYRVGCAPINQLDKKLFKESIILKEVENHTVYIMPLDEDVNTFINEGEYVGLSSVHQGIESLVSAYQQALRARQEAFCSNKKYIQYKEVESINEGHPVMFYTFDEALMLQIVQMIGANRISEALRILKLMAQTAQDKHITYTIFERNLHILIEEITNTYQNVLQIEGVEIAKLTQVLDYTCAELYMKALSDWMIEINENITNKFDDYKNKQKIKKALEYIKENYDKDLNMAVVSNHISMNYSLFSYVFKQYTGQNFVTYLKELRVAEAKNLLANTELKVNEISHQIGYDNEKHFMKIFKAVCGVSPTEYRKNMAFK